MATRVTEKSGAPASAAKEERRKPAPAARTGAPRRPHFFRRTWRYLHEVWGELQRTQWPSRAELIRSTQVVFGLLLAVGLYIFVLDVIIGFVIGAIVGRR